MEPLAVTKREQTLLLQKEGMVRNTVDSKGACDLGEEVEGWRHGMELQDQSFGSVA